MFEFLVEKETEARKLSEAEASRVAADVGDLWKDWDEARSKQKTIAEKLRPEIYLDDRPAKDRGEGNWKSDVHLNKIYSLSQTQQAFIWDNIYSNNEKLFDVAGIKMQFPLISNEQIIEYYDSTASTVSGIFPNMQGQDEAKDATATEIQVKVQGQTTRLAKTLDAIKQNGIVPMVEKVAALDANMKFGDEVVYVENDGMKTAVVIGDTVRQGNYEYKYTDNTGIQRKLAKNQELIQLLGNVWNDQAVPLNKVEIVKDILANAEFENVDKYFLEQNTAMTPQLAGNVQPLPAAGLETREVTNGQANGIDTLA